MCSVVGRQDEVEEYAASELWHCLQPCEEIIVLCTHNRAVGSDYEQWARMYMYMYIGKGSKTFRPDSTHL